MTDAPPWTSTATLLDLAQWLRARARVVVVTHAKPDGDALGSSLAAVRSLNLLPAFDASRPRAVAWFWGPRPDWAQRLIRGTPSLFLGDSLDHAIIPPGPEPDAVLILDTGAWSQLHALRGWLGARTDRAAVVDHHVAGNTDLAPRRFIDTSASAVCQPVAELCRLLLDAPAPSALPAEVAEALYFGLASDTGWFRHSNVTPAVFRLAADLLEAGASHASLYEESEQRERLPRLKLLARALASLELVDDGRFAFLTLRHADFLETGASPGDSGGFTDFGHSIDGVRAVALFTEVVETPRPGAAPAPITKVSLRSKAGPHTVNVNAVAAALGGGGHVQAAGARLVLPLDAARAAILDALRRQTHP